MADAMQGIMSLGAGAPEGAPPEAAPPSPTPEIPPEAFQGFSMAQQATGDPRQTTKDMMDSMQEADPELVLQFRQMLASIDMPDELMDAMGKMVDLVLSDSSRYAEIRQELITEGVPEDLLPPEFDPAYFMAFNVVLDEIAESKSPATQGSSIQAFAKGGIATLNPVMQGIASMGRNQDTQLAHLMPSEARMLRRYGGSGAMNPRTGLSEYGFLGSIGKAIGGAFKKVSKVLGINKVFETVKKAVKSITSSTIGRMVLTIGATMILGPMIAPYLATVGLAGAATGITAGLVSTGISLATGASLKDSLKQGLIAGVTAQAFQFGGEKLGLIKPTAIPADTTAPLYSNQVSNLADEAVSSPTTVSPEGDFIGDVATGDVGQSRVNAFTNKIMQEAKAPISAPASSVNDSILAAIQKPSATVPSAAPSGTYALDGSSARLPGVGASDMVKADYLNPDLAKGATGSSFSPSNLYNKVADKVSDAYQGTKDIYKEYLSPAGIRDQGIDDAVKAIQDKFPTITRDEILNAGKDTPLNKLFMDALPGTLAQYGPLAATIGAGAYAAGAFEGQPAEKPELPTLGSDLFAANPQAYLTTPGGVNTLYYGDIQGAQYGPQKMKTGGIADLPTKYPRKNGPINGPGTGTSDDIPAMLSDGEFVFTAKAVRNMGAGSRRLGAKRMYTMMKALEKRSA
jgi:hypothetical protein